MSVTVLGIKLTLDGAQQVESGMKRVVTTTDDLGTSAKNVAGYMKGMLGSALGGLTFAAMAQQVVSVQREFDVLNSSLVTVTGSSGAAAKEFAWIREFAATTPFQLNEVTQAFVKMRALGLDANRDALASYGNWRLVRHQRHGSGGQLHGRRFAGQLSGSEQQLRQL